MRKVFFIVFCLLSLTWDAASQTSTQSASFNQFQIGSTNYMQPKTQMRFPAYRFNPPMIFDIGGSSTLQNIFQVVPLTTANTLTFQVAAPGQPTTIKLPDPAIATATVMYKDASTTVSAGDTWSSFQIFQGQNLHTLTSNQIVFGAAAHQDILNFAAPAAASQTYTFPDVGGNASVAFINPASGQTQFAINGSASGTVTQITVGAAGSQTVTWPASTGTVALMPAAGGTITTNGTQVNAGTCQAQPALTITGVTTSSVVSWSVPTALPATWQTGIFVMPVVTSNTVTLNICNGTAGNLTPAAQTVNIRALV